jgi:hypothetical protein
MKHTFRGAVTAWMALIVLQTVGSAGGSSKVASLFADINGLVTRALSPDVPAIPDRRGAFKDKDGNVHPYIPGWLGGGTTTSPGSGRQSNPRFRVGDPPPTGQHNPAYDNPDPNQPGGIQE